MWQYDVLNLTLIILIKSDIKIIHDIFLKGK